ncbi:CBS domain-containing protein [Halorhabdus amylolytica]|uniref:CBS domain-containing protein n=1 Tax=Halorhabdus amylolytica TaxID=2559573 RepID=UPI001B7D7C64|nr:CBS domain-containing protein [Halorhabdus amylolytica]
MVQDRYVCTADDLATQTIATKPPDASVAETSEWLEAEGFDAAPVSDGEDIRGYVVLEELQDAPSDDRIVDHTNPITIEEIISADATFEEVLAALYEEPFYFLGGQNRLTGILTRADLNTSPARMRLFDRITLLEDRLRELVVDVAPDWKERVALDPDVVEEIEKRHAEARRSNIELDEIHYAQFSTLATIVSDIEACWKACGFSSDHRASSQLDDLTELRNAVAHSQQVIQNTEGGLGEGRTIGTVEQTYTTLEDCLENLSS